MKNKYIISIPIALSVVSWLLFVFMTQSTAVLHNNTVEWISPYEGMDWENTISAKAQFHSHTTESDGELSPSDLVELYRDAGFDILAFTDHWKSTWPWENYVKDDVNHQILAIQGAEPSYKGISEHHMVSLFTDITGYDMEFEETLAIIEDAGGLVTFAHPARVTERNNNDLSDYIKNFDRFSQIYGIDIFTRATYSEPERWDFSKKLINDLLMHYGSPDKPGWRPIWLTSTDDLHTPDQINQGFQIQLIDELNQENVYNSLKNGCFFWVANGEGENPPVIESISFEGNTITVKGNGFNHIDWYFNNKVIHSGDTFDAKQDANNDVFYVYFIAYTENFSVPEKSGSLIGSQPFWIMPESKHNPPSRDGSSEVKNAFSPFSFLQKKQNRLVSGSEESDFAYYKLIAHRGGITSDIYNEFDPASVLEAINKGYYMLEVDIRETRDGQLIVHHDKDFQRFFNHPGKVNELTWGEIQTLRSDNGDYAPMSFEQVAAMCSGKIKLMIDVKVRTPEVFKKTGEIMQKYDLLNGAYFIQPEAREHFWGKAKFSFRVNQLPDIIERMDSGEDISQNFFLFDNGNLLYSEIIKWCQYHSITVVPSVNIGHYRFENHLDGAYRDIEFLKNCGVTEFQIDSHYDKWLRHE